MALGKILLGRWTADIYLEDCLKIRSTGVDNVCLVWSLAGAGAAGSEEPLKRTT